MVGVFNSVNYRSYIHSKGLSLVELALVMLILSLALVPVVKMIGGPISDKGAAVQVVGQKSKALILGNAIIEKTLATDYSTFNCGGSFDPKTGFPDPGQSKTMPTSRCTDNSYNQPLYYQWGIRNMDLTGQKMPDGNHYYTAVLNVWDTASAIQPILSLPTAFYWNEGNLDNEKEKVGIMIVQDRSGSMMVGSQYYDYENISVESSPTDPTCPSSQAASPYLKYRYSDPSIGYEPATGTKITDDIFDNSKLDIPSFLQADDLTTDWPDNFMIKPGVLGLPDCETVLSWNSSYWKNYFQLIKGKPDTRGTSDTSDDIPNNNRYVQHVNALCGINAAPSSPIWDTTLDKHLSRFEVARSSLLNFILSMENNSDLYQNSKIGFLTFSYTAELRVPPEAAVNGLYRNMRRKLTWMNRAGTTAAFPAGLPTPQNAQSHQNGPILPGGATNLYYGVYTAAKALFDDKNLKSRILIIVGDGDPTCGQTCGATIAMCHGGSELSEYYKLGDQIGNGTFPGANGKKATIFSIGLMAQGTNMSQFLGDALARRTPGGEYFVANSLSEVKPVFEQVQYQVQRMVLLNKSERYNVHFDEN